ncbi:hypothetical protein [Maridesulfovibrio salexigens]|uniref:Uncharacterized protein n=1 Tax=Maridesulfovibrio salexigens (strain ATCC 14822 / DSM 2638 / NCIMB 8403 / VKM B-1763) TaxID=526222 RepID=C6BZB5_MARSD|nr:hypothetical protein [Maridesulfovibrio salexigens]ACS80752.1 hypothetical protein Desal_2698 [Maridesulfovibrio salexigens DSM 2638]
MGAINNYNSVIGCQVVNEQHASEKEDTDLNDILKRIEKELAKINFVQSSDIKKYDTIISELAIIRLELAKKDPDKNLVKLSLDRIGHISSITGLVEQIYNYFR